MVLEIVVLHWGEYFQIVSVEAAGPGFTLKDSILAVSLVEAADVVGVEVELPGAVPSAGVDAPPAPASLELAGSGLSEETVKLLPLPDDVENLSPVAPVHFQPPPGQPGRVEDAEEAPAYASPLRPEGLHETVPHHGYQQLMTLPLQHLAGVLAGVQVSEVKDGDVAPSLPCLEVCSW